MWRCAASSRSAWASALCRNWAASCSTGPTRDALRGALARDDPERVARYVQVQDASTARQYFLRVPPTIQTAAEAVAWSFQLAVEEYDPAQET